MVRSQLASSPSAITHGEILNKATSFLDHSIVYGNEESEMIKARAFVKGKLRMSVGNVLPVDVNGNYLESSVRLAVAPIGAIFPALFARNHNKIAEAFSLVNPHWDDETLFQEARRANIAVFQNVFIQGRFVERVFKRTVNETYNENVDPSSSIEFSTGAYRFGHFFVQSDMLLVDSLKNVEKISISDSLGRIDLLETSFDDVLRGLLSQKTNSVQYSDEVNL